ncbi:TPA: hypothetical protein U9I93_002533 [Acinetobacter baumannii]|uniref:hypothetical protein n=1 Tax=Acinetobacter baumannii TaxID=470 RepID=UPI000F73794F|nr:hypothetical protein [Acinetobacter baumannii]MDV7675939.1 hypothetical protein [Acinetobacter baumannii]RSQ42712.1 hypothetical protein EA703_13590 [Acinetobacter baumannii]WNX69416.1 hypothetical protein RW078_11745 [Acinetobacter baumannii]HEN9536211.1 hypothetical protein [Acinetobacter baumannii]
MNFDEFFESIPKTVITDIKLENQKKEKNTLLSNEALFQLPLICLIILMLSKDRRKPDIAEIGQLVGECIEASFHGFKSSAQHIGWSANLRIRTIKAVNFLEITKLIEVDYRKKKIVATDLGMKVINSALLKEDDLSYNLAKISRSYRNICLSKNLDMELWNEIN